MKKFCLMMFIVFGSLAMPATEAKADWWSWIKITGLGTGATCNDAEIAARVDIGVNGAAMLVGIQATRPNAGIYSYANLEWPDPCVCDEVCTQTAEQWTLYHDPEGSGPPFPPAPPAPGGG